MGEMYIYERNILLCVFDERHRLLIVQDRIPSVLSVLNGNSP